MIVSSYQPPKRSYLLQFLAFQRYLSSSFTATLIIFLSTQSSNVTILRASSAIRDATTTLRDGSVKEQQIKTLLKKPEKLINEKYRIHHITIQIDREYTQNDVN